ncbi:hypothetical protein J5U21_02277 [Saccharolobus shibatae]|uniref:Uncharacterized protein n=1 Tax=Saccharolobus shibatae TaxID=2286 RepID=A0A8F5GX25_9CREN|nr:hypothetical protein J5U21_02277 [Saccharolobus shibatae]
MLEKFSQLGLSKIARLFAIAFNKLILYYHTSYN